MKNSLLIADDLRKHIANQVLKDTAYFNEAILGKEPNEYAKWI